MRTYEYLSPDVVLPARPEPAGFTHAERIRQAFGVHTYRYSIFLPLPLREARRTTASPLRAAARLARVRSRGDELQSGYIRLSLRHGNRVSMRLQCWTKPDCLWLICSHLRAGLQRKATMASNSVAHYYADEFYGDQIDGSYRSAGRYVETLSRVHKPRAVVDVGCGRGAWLKAFKESGSTRLVGYDGPWNSQDKMIDTSIGFVGIDLNAPPTFAEERFEMALSLEVAEHLEPESASRFVRFMVELSDVVMFGAAYSKQGGTNHINEQPHSYWANLFAEQGYLTYDLFRPILWGDSRIEFWYRQNTFLYVKKNTPLNDVLAEYGCFPLRNLLFMNCVHPDLYEAARRQDERWSHTKFLVRQLVSRAIPKSIKPLVKRGFGVSA